MRLSACRTSGAATATLAVAFVTAASTCLLTTGTATAAPVAASSIGATAAGEIRANQVAYAPAFVKRATLVSSSTSPVAWELHNASGATVAKGTTKVLGADAASGDSVHLIDFSSYRKKGTGYTLVAESASSFPFDISPVPLQKLRYDTLAFFYHQRQGVPIESKYVGSTYARAAGHLGDTDVACRTDCGYTLDVSGGWYDAGDHGKYVVNGGIAAWQLQNQYERTLHAKGGKRTVYANGKMAIPENTNKLPDLLDEARFEVDFLMKMQAPSGPNQGMVHHKMHDDTWTSIPTIPANDTSARHLAPVSTAATLNMAAAAAQCARLWKTLDKAFSTRCLTAAKTAYAAAKAHPNVLASSSDGTGGGAYSDSTVTDEFYWAAAELYITTKDAAYKADLTASPLAGGKSLNLHGFDWGSTGAMGDISLATVPNGLPAAQKRVIKKAITSTADALLASMAKMGYPAPYETTDGSYEWGSNGLVANNGNVLATAFDLTQKVKYRDGATEALSYLLGRNPMASSYVAGYGTQRVHNVHHRFWAHQSSASLPEAPPGAVSGGPNSGLQDPAAAAALAGCKPQKCWLDDIESYSTNEVAINWNSAVASLAGWVAEKAAASAS